MKIAVIPARGGSKRIPRKNIKDFCGKPMIAWSIETAFQSGCFDKVIVSTDDSEIAAVAKKYGAEVPFMRPKELANDYAGTIPVIAHAAQWLLERDNDVKYACCIYATAPFIEPSDLQKSLQLLLASNANYSLSVTSFPYPIQRAIRLSKNNSLEMFYPEHFHTRSQDLEEAWHDAGQLYWGRVEAWLQQKQIFDEHSIAYKIPRMRAQDIDTPEDWEKAELMFKALKI